VAYHPWHDVELPRFIDEPVPAVIEIPTGSKVKYELDKRTGLLVVDRILFSAVHYPADYGFIPRTYCDDGDPLDVLVLCSEQIQPLAIMRAKIIGVMKMRDDKGEDDKIIAVHADDPNYSDYGDLWQIPPHRLRELQRFFQDYKALENKRVLVKEPLGRAAALQVLREAIRLYDRERQVLMNVPAPGAPAEPKARPRPAARRAGRARKARRAMTKARR
jgi:inorganic pyrophosphatase